MTAEQRAVGSPATALVRLRGIRASASQGGDLEVQPTPVAL
jgi:hypothetical protein